MTGTLTLNIAGPDSGPFDIYQDSDNFTTAIATNVAGSTLTSGTSISLDAASKTVRVVSQGNCLNYKDIDINFGQDTSPSITVATDTLIESIETKSIRLATDGKNFLWAPYADNKIMYSNNNGDSWTQSVINSISKKYPIYDQSSIWYIRDNSTAVFEITSSSFGNTTAHHTTDIVLGSGEGFRNYFWHNNYYYIATDLRLLRSSNNINFDAVINYPADRGFGDGSQKQLVGYGNTLYHSSPHGKELYKSTDNGRNWSLLRTSSTSYRYAYLYIEDANKIMYAGVAGNDTPWTYSTDGGATWGTSWITPAQDGTLGDSLSAGIYKYNDIYYYLEYSASTNDADRLSYTADSPFSATGTKIDSVPSVYLGRAANNYTSLALMHLNRGRMHLLGNFTPTATTTVSNTTKAITIDIENT
jgi:hypothetical protein